MSPWLWNLAYIPDINFPVAESSGPKYRKVSLLGRPMSDDKPQSEDETDYTAPETYVDALTLGLRHDSVDYSLKIPNSDISISVRRNYSPQIWNLKNGLRPHERFDMPYGSGWSSNLVAYARFENQILANGSVRTSPDTVTVIDENGMSLSFAVAIRNNSREFLPLPNDKSDAQAFLNKLTMESDGTLVLKKRFGTKLTYEAANIELRISSDRFRGGYPKTEYEYYRLTKVEDKFGNALMYVYSDVGASKKLLPSRIYWNKKPETAIAIQEDSYGNIATIYCPENLTLSYTYGNIDYNRTELSNDEEYVLPVSAYVRVLKTVSKCGENMQSYSYGAEVNPRCLRKYDFIFIRLKRKSRTPNIPWRHGDCKRV